MSAIQSIIFSKDDFRTRKEVRDYIRSRGFHIRYGIDEKKNTFRVRQKPPSNFRRFRVEHYARTPGVQYVIGFY